MARLVQKAWPPTTPCFGQPSTSQIDNLLLSNSVWLLLIFSDLSVHFTSPVLTQLTYCLGELCTSALALVTWKVSLLREVPFSIPSLLSTSATHFWSKSQERRIHHHEAQLPHHLFWEVFPYPPSYHRNPQLLPLCLGLCHSPASSQDVNDCVLHHINSYVEV